MTFGLQCDEKTSFAILDRAAEGGITFIDTADAYPLGGTMDTAGRSEEIVGKWLRGRRANFIVSRRSGPVEMMSTGAPTSSSNRCIYPRAGAGSALADSRPAVLVAQPGISS